MSILGHGIEITESVSEPSGGDLADDVTTIGRLVLNGSVTGKYHEGILNLDPPIFDVDWFAFAAEANTDYQFTANQGQRYPKLNVLRIFDDEGTELRNSLIKPRVDSRQEYYNGVDRLNSIAFRTHTAVIFRQGEWVVTLYTAQRDGITPLVDLAGVEALAQFVADRL